MARRFAQWMWARKGGRGWGGRLWCSAGGKYPARWAHGRLGLPRSDAAADLTSADVVSKRVERAKSGLGEGCCPRWEC